MHSARVRGGTTATTTFDLCNEPASLLGDPIGDDLLATLRGLRGDAARFRAELSETNATGIRITTRLRFHRRSAGWVGPWIAAKTARFPGDAEQFIADGAQ